MDAPHNWLIDEACGGHGTPSPVAAPYDVRGFVRELLAVPPAGFYCWNKGGLEDARRAMAVIDARIEQQKKMWEGKQW